MNNHMSRRFSKLADFQSAAALFQRLRGPPYPAAIKDGDKKNWYNISRPNKSGWLQVQANLPHKIYWAEYGNPHGEPVMIFHGGPGARASSSPVGYLNSQRYRAIIYGQRGGGDNEPNAGEYDATAALTDNTTPHLVDDIPKLFKELDIRSKMHLLGGSWGTTLAMAYAIKYPHTVQTIIMRAAFLCRKVDIDYFFQGNAADFEHDPYAIPSAGAYLNPVLWDPWAKYVKAVPPEDRHDMVAAFAKIFSIVPQNNEERERVLKAARALADWDSSVRHLSPDRSYQDDEAVLRMYRIMIHYMMNDPLFGRNSEQNRGKGYILNHVGRLSKIPMYIVHGEDDEECHPHQARSLAHAARAVGNENVNLILTKAGHGGGEDKTRTALTRIMNDLPMMSRFDLGRRWYHRIRPQLVPPFPTQVAPR